MSNNNMLWWWSLYLNRCVAASASEALEAPGPNSPFTLDLILLELEGGHYVGPILLGPLEDLLARCRLGGGNSGSSSSSIGGGG